MDRSRQTELARSFREMHRGPGVLVLPNAWDVASAKLYEVDGFRALATTSAGISAALGYADGERMSLDDNLAVCRRIIERVAIPVSLDIEAGYAGCLGELATTTSKVLATGAVGINIEDSAKAGCGGSDAGALVEVSAQMARISEVRQAAERAGVPLVINARTDVLLQHGPPTPERMAEAVDRGNAYLRAGADCVFVPDMETLGPPEIAALASAIEGPLNLVAGGRTPNVARLRELRVARLSFGPRPMRAALSFLRAMAREWRSPGTYERMVSSGALSYDEVNSWFEPCHCETR